MESAQRVSTATGGDGLSYGDKAEPRQFRIAGWLVEPSANRIEGADKSLRVEPKVMHVLLCLVRQKGETLSIDQLLDEVWTGTVVEENALRRAVSQLRKAFDDDPRSPRIIETIPKKGYRLIADVSFESMGDSYPATASDIALSTPSFDTVSAQDERRVSWLRPAFLVSVVLLAIAALAAAVFTPNPSEPVAKIPVSSFPGLETAPALSADGSQVAFVWHGAEGGDAKIYVKHVDADTPERLTQGTGQEVSPSWSSDGHSVAFLRYTQDSCGIFIATVVGHGERKVDDCRARTRGLMDWSPTGDWMAFSMRPDTLSHRIILIAPEAGERRLLTTPGEDWDTNPVFSPDGKWVSFKRMSRRTQSLMVVPLTGGEPRLIASHWGNIVEHDWTPDGQYLVFSSDKGGNYRLWKVPVAGGTPSWMSELGTYDPSNPAFAAFGGRMAYIEWNYDFNIWRVSTSEDEATGERFIASSKWNLHPRYAPDGQHIAFTSSRTGNNELWVSDKDGQALRRLTSFGTAFVSTPRWSPDSKQLVFEVRKEATADLYIIPAEGGAPIRFTDHPEDELAPSWSRDGQWIYFSSRRSGQWEVWKKPVVGGEATQVTTDAGFASVESADGKQLYFSKGRGLWRMPVDGGVAEQVLEELIGRDWGNWALHPDGIYYVQRTGEGARLAFFDFASKASRAIMTPTYPLPISKASLTLSPDGSHLLFTQTESRESDIVLVEGTY